MELNDRTDQRNERQCLICRRIRESNFDRSSALLRRCFWERSIKPSSTPTGLRISATGHPRTAMAAGLSIVTVAFFVLAAGIKLGPVFIGPVTFAIGAGLGSTMPAAQTMVQWAAAEKRPGVGTATVSFSRTIGGVMGATLSSAVLLGALQVADPNARVGFAGTPGCLQICKGS
jgi:hypothetical protein